MGTNEGGRVHWFLLHLSPMVKTRFKLFWDYEYHNYALIRTEKRTLIDVFVVVRSSERCFRVIYFNKKTLYFEYFSARNAKAAAELVNKKAARQKRAEQRGSDEKAN